MGGYRDDRDALRFEKAKLTEDLADARHELGEKEAEIARLESELAAARETAPVRSPLATDQLIASTRPRRRWVLPLAVLAGVAVLGGVALIVIQAPPAPGTVAPDRLLTARVTNATGKPSLKAGAACQIEITGSSTRYSKYNCHVSVRCGGASLYGHRHGYCTCAVQDGQFINANDPWPNDGDPALSVDAISRSASVATSSWRVEMQLDDTLPNP